MEHEYDGTNAVYEEELAAKDHLARQCQKAEAEANLWRLKVKKEKSITVQTRVHKSRNFGLNSD